MRIPFRFLVLAATMAGLAHLSATRAETTRTVLISASDAKGPITDLKAADLTVKEGGKDAAIASLEGATGRLDVMLLVDDLGSGAFQAGVLQLLQSLVNNATFTIMEFKPQTIKLLDSSNDVKALQDTVLKLGPRGKIDHDGENLADTIGNAAKVLRQRNAARPVIIVLTISGVGQVRNPNLAMNDLRDTGVMFNVVYVSNADIGQVISDGPRQTGGRIEQASGANGVQPAVQKIIDALVNQYVLTYKLADGVKPSDRLSVATTRKGVTLYAPQRVLAK